MNTLVLATVETGSVIVAVSLLLLVGIIMVAAIMRAGIDGAIRIWGALGTLVGLIVGTMGAYFFTKDANTREIARVAAEKTVLVSQNVTLKNALLASESEKTKLGEQVSQLATNFKAQPNPNSDLLRATASELQSVGKQLKETQLSDLLSTPDKPK